MKFPKSPEEILPFLFYLRETVWPLILAYFRDAKSREISRNWIKAKTPEEKSDAIKKLADHQNRNS